MQVYDQPKIINTDFSFSSIKKYKLLLIQTLVFPLCFVSHDLVVGFNLSGNKGITVFTSNDCKMYDF
jgi:hypothetical protein